LSLDEIDGVEDEGAEAVDGGSKPQDLTGQAHARPDCVGLSDFGHHFVAEVGLGVVGLLVDGAQVLGEVLEESAELGGEGVTF
jgi:hypothetical protein